MLLLNKKRKIKGKEKRAPPGGSWKACWPVLQILRGPAGSGDWAPFLVCGAFAWKWAHSGLQ